MPSMLIKNRPIAVHSSLAGILNVSLASPAASGAVHRRQSVRAYGKKSQKNEGVYFEYEEVDPEEARRIPNLEDQLKEEFGWAQRTREQEKRALRKYKSIERVLGDEAEEEQRARKPGKAGNKRGKRPQQGRPGPNSGRGAQEQTQEQTQQQPRLPPYAPVKLAGSEPAEEIPMYKLERPPLRPGTTPPTFTGGAAGEGSAAGSSTAIPGTSSTSTSSEPVAGSDANNEARMQSRKDRLMQRMKGSSTQAASAAKNQEATAPGVLPAAAAAGIGAAAAASAAVAASAGVQAQPSTSQQQPQQPGVVQGGDDVMYRQLAELAGQLPPDEQLSEDARTAKQLLTDILTSTSAPASSLQRPSSSMSGSTLPTSQAALFDELLQALELDGEESREFAQWMTDVQQQAASASASQQGPVAANGSTNGASTSASNGNGSGVDDDELDELMRSTDAGLADFQALARQLAELGGALSRGDMADAAAVAQAGAEDSELSDTQVLAQLAKADPSLYDLVRDVEEFAEWDNLRLNLDLDLTSGSLSAADLAELRAEEGLAGPAGRRAAGGSDDDDDEDGAGGQAGQGDEEAELEALLAQMREMGLGQGDDDDMEDFDEDGMDDEDDDEDVDIGELFDMIEDSTADERDKLHAQYALQSTFNMPAEELRASAKALGASGSANGSKDGAEVSNKGLTTTGLAGGSGDDTANGGDAPLLKPKPKPRS